ncbi:MAG: hypothetical protein M3Y87_23755 [Myxococcota bacterium]|nr:hypothetical protein [Myxococcota bacterium]
MQSARWSRSWSVLWFAVAVGCGGGGAGEAEPSAAETSGGEATAIAAAPSGPPLSFLPQGTKVVARLDMARVRRSPIASDISSAIRATETWQRLAGTSGIDPVQDFDAMLVGGDALYTDRRVVVIRHPRTEAEVRQRILAMAIDRGAAPEWREVFGLPAVPWPMPRSSVSYSLVITAPNELVLAPDDDLERIAAVARDHAARRPARSTAAIEPQLAAMRAAEIATIVLDVPPPARAGYPEPPQHTLVEVDESAAGDAVIAIHSEFESEAQASAAHAWLRQQVQFYSGQMMVRAIGMNRPLEEARFALDGTRLALGTHLTPDELRRLLGMLALSQLASN